MSILRSLWTLSVTRARCGQYCIFYAERGDGTDRTLTIKVKGQWKYFYRAVDKAGDTLDFLLRAHRDKAAAKRYLEKSIEWNGEPEVVTINKSGANLAALEAIHAGR
ncbi:transposase-like protein [Paraburkholderia youngii]